MAVIRSRRTRFVHGFMLATGQSGIALRTLLISTLMGWLGSGLARAGGDPCLPDECPGRECLFDGVKNSPLGQAELKITQDCNLLIQNIGSSGLDGFRQTAFRETALQVITGFRGLRAPDNGIGANIKIFGQAAATAMDGTEQAQGAIVAVDVTVENPIGNEVAVTPDSSGTGTTLYTIRIISRGDVVAEEQDLQKATTRFSSLAAILQFDFRVDQGFMFIYQLDGLFEITIPNRGTTTGDTVQVVSQNPQVRVVEIIQVDTTLVNIPAIEVTVEYGGPVVGGGVCIDLDNDGFGNPGDPSCPAGPETDCNDNNRAISPSASESCNGVDDDCDGRIDEDFDLDNDGFTTCNGDCDDTNAFVNPRITEVCNGIDDNCNGVKDEGFDRDNDGFTSCGGDCDDDNPLVNPDKPELCNGIDDDCDGTVDEGFDQDGDGFTTCGGDCDDTNPAVNPDKKEVCNGIDDDCDESIDEGFDRDGDGFTTCGGDCDDTNPAVNPEKKEVCNGIDDDCDESIDEGFDRDGDGFTTCGGDCDDTNPAVNPDKQELCNGIDDDCDESIDEGFDQDGDGFTTCGGDCDDTNPAVNPEKEEICNGIDDDCDGSVDEGFDQDGDGFTTCGGDCDDTNPGINPEKEEICTGGLDEDCDELIDGDDPDCIGVKEVCDGIDNDGDGQIDEDFTLLGVNQDQGSRDYGTVQELPVGSACMAGIGECEALSSVICSRDGRTAICADRSTRPETEGPTGDATCFDSRDNDCDGLIDQADPDCTGPERCDRFDNDNDGLIDEDFPTLGDLCTAGTGICEKKGFIECRASGAGVVCSAAPGGVAGTESPPGSRFCTDGRDNDCDGLVDGDDPDCQEEEKCDGLDNDNDQLVDEDFPQLGQPCTTGEGHCEAEGKFVCSPDGSGVRCDTNPIAAQPEGPAGCSCFDGIDNDCDGDIDAGDFNCRSARIADTVRCSLRSRRGINNRCSGLYEISFSSSQPGVSVLGRLLAIKADGNTTERLIVQDGDLAFLQSTTEPGRGSPTGTISFGRRSIHWMFAANPVLEVIADDGRNVGRAYCSILPYMEVVEPDTTVVSLSEGDETRVLAAIPLVDPASLQVKVDGVDVLAALGLNPTKDFPGGPYRGSFLIPSHGLSKQRLVEVCDLTVRSGVSGKASANTLTMTLTNMGCGGHIVVVDGEPARDSLPRDPNAACNLDDLRDTGISHALGIELNTPADGDVILSNVVIVNGQACHGRQLGRLRIAGADLPITSQTLLPGDGENSVDTWLLGFEARVLINDLRTEFDTGTPTPGRLDPGSNRLIAQVADVDFNTSFDNVFIAVGPVRGTAATTTAALPPIPNAFVLALDGPGMTTFVSSLCDSLKPLLKEKVEGALDGKSTEPKNFPACKGGSNNGDECEDDDDCPGGQCKGMPFPLCNVKNVVFEITDVDLDVSQFECRLVPQQDKITFGITTPAFSVRGHASGGCADHFLGVCTVSVTIDSDAELSLDNIDVGFEITEQGILNQEFISNPTFDFGDNPSVIEGSVEVPDVGCIVGFFKFLFEVNFFIIKILSFGLIDISFDEIEFELSSDDLKEKIAEKGGDFGGMKEVRFDNERLPEFNLDLSNLLTDVQITPQGLAIGITASFDAIEIDPEVADTPGTILTPAPLPQPPIPNADEVTVAISDDVFNTLLGGLARGGILKTLFEDRRELGDFLPDPADCAGLGPVREPRCVGTSGGDCSQFTLQIQRDRCETAAERFESRNLRRNTVIILHGRADNPPKLLIDDDPKTQPIEVHLRYSQIAIGIFADRDGDGVLEGTPGSIPSCFGSNQSTTTECALWEACLNVNVPMIVSIPPDRLALRFEVLDFQHDLSTGTLCGGGVEDENDDLILEAAQGQTLDLLNQKLREGIPELDSKGLSFGGLVEFQNPRLIVIENDGNPEFQDYIAITGKLVVPKPKDVQ